MKLLITGICGFVGSRLAQAFRERQPDIEIFGIDNLYRPGSETNPQKLSSLGIKFIHGDLRLRSDVDALPPSDWVIDAAANPSVLAGITGASSARQVCEHNLQGTLNLLEYCRLNKAGLLLLSTSRVYGIRELSALPMRSENEAFVLDEAAALPTGVSSAGLTEAFPTNAPISLYGATKLASEVMAIEYGFTFDFPVWINRCGVLAGAGQFGTAEQGIFSYWIHAHAAKLPLRYISFGGKGYQVRDAFHPDDLAELILLQIKRHPPADPIFHASGGRENAMSLAQLTAWCNDRFGEYKPDPDLRPRPFDIPWLVMDSGRSMRELNWSPKISLHSILDEIVDHARQYPDWLQRCGSV